MGVPWGHIVQICEANTACKVCRIHVAFVVSVGGFGSTHRRLCTARAADSILPCTPPGQFHSCNLARTKLTTSKDRRSRFCKLEWLRISRVADVFGAISGFDRD